MIFDNVGLLVHVIYSSSDLHCENLGQMQNIPQGQIGSSGKNSASHMKFVSFHIALLNEHSLGKIFDMSVT